MAQTFRGGEIFRIKGTDLYWAAVKTQYFKSSVARQKEDHWCWAACVQMVLHYQGVSVSQDEILKRSFGSIINKGGNAYDIQRGANGWHTGSHTIAASIGGYSSFSAESIINDLRDKYPIIVGLEMPYQVDGHAYVLTGISFKIENGEYKPQEVILRNPWPTSPSRSKMSWSEFRRRVNIMVHVYPK